MDDDHDSIDSGGSSNASFDHFYHTVDGIGISDTWRNTTIRARTNALKPNHIFDLNFLHSTISYFMSASRYAFFNAVLVFSTMRSLIHRPTVVIDQFLAVFEKLKAISISLNTLAAVCIAEFEEIIFL